MAGCALPRAACGQGKRREGKQPYCPKTCLWFFFFLQRHQDFYDSLFTVCSNSPRSLMHLCRCAIRATLSERCHRGVPLLSIPLSMKKYLLLEPEGIIYWAATERAPWSSFLHSASLCGVLENQAQPWHSPSLLYSRRTAWSWAGIYRLSSELLSFPYWGIAAAGCGVSWGRQIWKDPRSQQTHSSMTCST